MNKIKHDNFVRIATNRKIKVISILNQLNNLSNTSFYEFDKKEIEDIFNEIASTCDNVKNNLTREKKKKENYNG